MSTKLQLWLTSTAVHCRPSKWMRKTYPVPHSFETQITSWPSHKSRSESERTHILQLRSYKQERLPIGSPKDLESILSAHVHLPCTNASFQHEWTEKSTSGLHRISASTKKGGHWGFRRKKQLIQVPWGSSLDRQYEFVGLRDSRNHKRYSVTIPWSWVFIKNPPVAQLLKNLPTFHKTRRLITVFIRALILFLSSIRSVQCIPTHPISPTSILILSSHIYLGLPNSLSPYGFLTIIYVYKVKHPCNRPWRTIGLWDVADPKLSVQSAHRLRLGCQPCEQAALYHQKDLLVFISVTGWVNPRTMVRLKGFGKLKKFNDLNGTRKTRHSGLQHSV
jgi:hypothetical protein